MSLLKFINEGDVVLFGDGLSIKLKARAGRSAFFEVYEDGQEPSYLKVMKEDETITLMLGESEINVTLKAKSGRQALLDIAADRSIGITTVAKNRVWVGMPA